MIPPRVWVKDKDGKPRMWRLYVEGSEPKRYKRKRSMLERGMKGLTLRPERIILISRELEPEETLETLLHELLHAVIGPIATWLGDADEERLIEAIDAPLLGVLLQIRGALAA